MSGCAGLLGIMEQMKGKELNYGLRFVFCGSEERGLLGAKAYVRDHEKELRQIVLNINLDMIGTYMGKIYRLRIGRRKAYPLYQLYGCRSWLSNRSRKRRLFQ